MSTNKLNAIPLLVLIAGVTMLLTSCFFGQSGGHCSTEYWETIPTPHLITEIENNTQGVQGLDGAWGIAVSPDSKHLYVTGSEDNSLVVFAKDTETEQFSSKGYTQTIKNGDTLDTTTMLGLGNARAVLVSEDGKKVYASGYEDDALVVFNRNKDNGKLSVVETLIDGNTDSFGNRIDGLDGAWEMVASQDSAYIYVLGYEDDALVVFKNTDSGNLRHIQTAKNTVAGVQGIEGIDGPRRIALGYEDKHLYVIGQHSDALVIFTRNDDGTVTYNKTYSNGGKDDANATISYMNSPSGLRIQNVNAEEAIYVSSAIDDSILYFKKDTSGKIVLEKTGREHEYYTYQYFYRNIDVGENIFLFSEILISFNSTKNKIDFNNNRGSREYGFLLRTPREIIEVDNNHIYITGSEADAILHILVKDEYYPHLSCS